LIAVLRNPEEAARYTFRFAEGWYRGRISVKRLRRELESLAKNAQELAGPIFVEEIDETQGPELEFNEDTVEEWVESSSDELVQLGFAKLQLTLLVHILSFDCFEYFRYFE